MSHCSLSTLKMGVCSCFIEPDNAIKMKKKKEEASYLHHWSMGEMVNTFFFQMFAVHKYSLASILLRIIFIYRKHTP